MFGFHVDVATWYLQLGITFWDVDHLFPGLAARNYCLNETTTMQYIVSLGWFCLVHDATVTIKQDSVNTEYMAAPAFPLATVYLKVDQVVQSHKDRTDIYSNNLI